MLIAADDRAALERLLRYCARPAFASERLEVVGQGDESERGDERIRPGGHPNSPSEGDPKFLHP